jgi:hypothetical protein
MSEAISRRMFLDGLTAVFRVVYVDNMPLSLFLAVDRWVK